MRIAVLALQGAFIEHEQMLDRINIPSFEIRQRQDIDQDFDGLGLIIPGGESTVQGKLLRELGLLLLAKRIENDETTKLATMDITVVRNAYGRQLGSFSAVSDFAHIRDIPMTFIRAPYLSDVSSDTQVLARVAGKIVAARQGNQLVTAFHPELNSDESVHRYFAEIVRNRLGK